MLEERKLVCVLAFKHTSVLACKRGEELADPRFELVAGPAEGGEDLLGCPAAQDGGVVDGPVELADV